jgi:hypothetical protein
MKSVMKWVMKFALTIAAIVPIGLGAAILLKSDFAFLAPSPAQPHGQSTPLRPAQRRQFLTSPFTYRNPGFDLGTPSDLATSTGVGRPAFSFRPLPKQFQASQAKGWSRSAVGMNVITPIPHFPTLPIGALRLWMANWAAVEPQPGQWDFSKLDAEIKVAQANQTPVLLVLGTVPRWASSDPDAENILFPNSPGTQSPPKQVDQWANYVRAVAQRYKGQVYAYEIWNEPTSALFWTGSPQQLAEITKVAAQVIHEVDPAAIVGSPSGTQTRDQYRDYVAWFEEFLQAGGGEGLDAIIWHFYTEGKPEEKLAQAVQEVRQMLDRQGLGHLPFWVTEGGYLKDPKDADMEMMQATAHISRYLLVGAIHGIDAFYYYTWDNAHDNAFHFATPDGLGTPAARAWAQTASWLVGAQVLGVATTPDNIWAMHLQRNGTTAYLVWDSDSEQRIEIPASWPVGQVMELNGNIAPIQSSPVQVGAMPKLLF